MKSMMEAPLSRPTRAKLEKILALANDERGDVQMRRSAKRILARYAKHFPDLLKKKER